MGKTLEQSVDEVNAEVFGVDISHHQGLVDWRAIYGAGNRFAFIKATEGNGFVDRQFTRNYNGARQAGLFVGNYHYLSHHINATQQAHHFLNITRDKNGVGNLAPVLDIEVDPTGDRNARVCRHSPNYLIAHIQEWIRVVERETGRNVILYSYPSFWRENLRNTTAWSRSNPLWIAHYGVPAPRIYGGWGTWSFWQFTSTGRVPGVAGRCDRNKWNGTLSRLRLMAGLGSPQQMKVFDSDELDTPNAFNFAANYTSEPDAETDAHLGWSLDEHQTE
jgi:GH25 family lysozyme M1 (1,4-beta-N-acetylmuramidase)